MFVAWMNYGCMGYVVVAPGGRYETRQTAVRLARPSGGARREQTTTSGYELMSSAGSEHLSACK